MKTISPDSHVFEEEGPSREIKEKDVEGEDESCHAMVTDLK